MLAEPEWRVRAAEVAEVLLRLARSGSRTGATWLVEDPFNATADLMVGCGGAERVGGPLLLRCAHGRHPAAP